MVRDLNPYFCIKILVLIYKFKLMITLNLFSVSLCMNVQLNNDEVRVETANSCGRAV